MLLKRRAGVVVYRALELGVPEGGELIGAVLRVLAVGVQAESAGHVAELERAEAEAGLELGPVGVEPARSRRRDGAAGVVARAGRLAPRQGGLQEELRVLPPVRGGELFQETGRIEVRLQAGGPFLPVRGAVEVQVAVLEDVSLAVGNLDGRGRGAWPVVTRMRITLRVAHRVAGLVGGVVRGTSILVWAVALTEVPAGVVRVEEVRQRVAQRGARLEVTGLELGADVSGDRGPRDDIGLGRGVVLRLEVERRARAVGG